MDTTACESKPGSRRVIDDLVGEQINLTQRGPSVNPLNPYIRKSYAVA
jgi:hypothetical protein